ncbi:MAG: hypothetical protein IJB96_03690 [Lachnospira sp.]|nr:hypothetical protein [Lachnospira sp.]
MLMTARKRKKHMIILGVIVIIIIIGSVIYYNRRVGEFSMEYYDYYLENFQSDITVEPIDKASDAKKAAQKIWIEKYGKDVLKDRPYVVYYDKENEVWLVEGTLLIAELGMGIGGVPGILIDKDGNVLAVWHGK